MLFVLHLSVSFPLPRYTLQFSVILKMKNFLLFSLLLCQLLQHAFVFAQIIFETTTAATTTTTGGNTPCQCYPGTTCPSGSGGIDVRIVNTGNTCSPGYVYCCSTTGATNCGIRKIPPSTHPVGQAAYGAYPWQVALLTNGNVYVGGGVLISPTHVLTVAHKVTNYVNGGIKARLGEWDARATTEPYPYREISVSKVTLHPQYGPQNLTNDVAVLKLSSAAPIATSPNINTACLPSAAVAGETRCWVSGWGKNAFGNSGTYESILKEVDVPVKNQADCQTALRRTRLSSSYVLDNSFVCAGGEAGKDACTGDGGSPLVCSINNGPYQVVGLVAWGIGCATAGVPGVYANVFNLLSWITQQMT